MNMRLRPVELGLIAVLGLTGPSGIVAADPACESTAAKESELSYVYVRDDNHTSMSGNTSDIERARQLKQPNEQIVWFRDGGKEYVIRDAATLKQVEAMWKPVDDIGEAQGKLGNQIGELGRQVGELGAQQGLLGTRQSGISIREANLSMRESNDSLGEAARIELGKQRQELQHQMRALNKQMRTLAKAMKEINARIEPLNREMNVLGQKMKVVSNKATGEMRVVFKRSIANGLARPVK